MKVLEVNKEDLKYNLEVLKNKVNFPKTNIIAVVKANGMGLDLVQFAKFLIENEVNTLAVANIDEAIKLRESGIESDIYMLSEVSDEEEIKLLLENNIITTIGNLQEKETIQKVANELSKKAKINVKIDTGFSRYGFIYNDENIFEAVKNTENINVVGCFTHFSKAIDYKWTNTQFRRFSELIPQIKELNEDIIFHCSNSTASLLYPEMNLDSVRIGSALTRKGA